MSLPGVNVPYLLLHVNTAVGASQDPCSNTFAGWTPFSEPECQAVADFLVDAGDRVTVFLTIHSYGQLWMAPWGYTYEFPDDYTELVCILHVRISGESTGQTPPHHHTPILYFSPPHFLIVQIIAFWAMATSSN